MKVVLTGGGSGGHFYPLVAVAQALHDEARRNHYIEPEIHYISDKSPDAGILFDNKMIFHKIGTGKMRIYFSPLNIIDWVRTFFAIFKALFVVFRIYPDVVFSKGGYAAFPTLFAARILRIPVIIHDSDSIPGRVNRWSGKFARKVAVTYPEASRFFKEDKVAWTGNPIRQQILQPGGDGAHEFLGLKDSIPTILILGGSQGAQFINDAVMEVLPELLEKFQVVHQTGEKNIKKTTGLLDVILSNKSLKTYYQPRPFLSDLETKMVAGVADIVITRAGSTLLEIAQWGIPAIVIPITESHGDHQRKNAFNYAHNTGSVVIEENNLTSSVLMEEIDRLFNNEKERDMIVKRSKEFARPQAAQMIADEIMKVIADHDK